MLHRQTSPRTHEEGEYVIDSQMVTKHNWCVCVCGSFYVLPLSTLSLIAVDANLIEAKSTKNEWECTSIYFSFPHPPHFTHVSSRSLLFVAAILGGSLIFDIGISNSFAHPR